MQTVAIGWLVLVVALGLYWAVRNTNRHFWIGFGVGLFWLMVCIATGYALGVVLVG